MKLISSLFKFVSLTTLKYNIDDSHGISHSMKVLHHSHDIFNNEIKKNPFLMNHEKIIYISSILHDMCDKKYMNESNGILEIQEFLDHQITKDEVDIITKIISTVSYSTVKKNGYPDLKEYQLAYHIVREADLLSGYDFDRSIIYNMHKENRSLEDAFIDAYKLFECRTFNHFKDDLLVTDYSKQQGRILHESAKKQIERWEDILDESYLYL